MKKIALTKWTGLEEILNWDYSPSSKVIVTVNKDARFKLLAEGTFLAAIQALKANSKHLLVKLTFDSGPILAASSEPTLPDFLNSLGGIALIQSADRITDSNDKDITEELVDSLWKRQMLEGEGVVGDGKMQSIISRFPGAPVPKCLREDSQIKTPTRLKFEQLLRRIGKGLGATGAKSTDSFLDSITEDELSGFLFEAFRNVIEHNTEDIGPGIWGIVVEKVRITDREDIALREQIPSLLHDYLRKAIGERVSKKAAFFLSVTVSDYGRGIQNTLPAEDGETETSWERLIRAFKRGVSRKPKSGSPDWGQGLPNILETIGHLRALLFIRSAEEAALADGLSGSPKWHRVSGNGTTCESVRGTSLSVIWIVSDEIPDQTTFKFE